MAKVERNEKFRPVIIILETQDDIDQLYGIITHSDAFNCSPCIKTIHEGLGIFKSHNYLNTFKSFEQGLNKRYGRNI